MFPFWMNNRIRIQQTESFSIFYSEGLTSQLRGLLDLILKPIRVSVLFVSFSSLLNAYWLWPPRQQNLIYLVEMIKLLSFTSYNELLDSWYFLLCFRSIMGEILRVFLSMLDLESISMLIFLSVLEINFTYKQYSMKQTIKTKSYNAVIEIPYQKLATKPNWTKLNNEQQQQCKKGSKTVIIPQCHGCCYSSSNQSRVSIQALEELEKAFQDDMQAKQKKIQEKDEQLRSVRAELLQHKKQQQKQRSRIQNQELKIQVLVKDHEQEKATMQKQLQLSNAEKQRLLRAKIAQFQNNYLQFQKQEAEKFGQQQQQERASFKEQIAKLTQEHTSQLARSKQECIRLTMQIDHNKQLGMKQLEYVQKQLQRYNEQVALCKKALQQKQIKISNYNQIINQNNLLLHKYEQQKQQAAQSHQQHLTKLQEFKQNTSKLQNLISMLQKKLQDKQQEKQQKDKQYAELCIQCQQTLEINKDLFNKNREINLQLEEGIKNRKSMESKIESLQVQIKANLEEYNKKEVPKVYEVKIQKVIDRKQYIQTIQTQLQKIRRSNLQLLQKIKQLQCLIAKKQKQIGEGSSKITALSQQILQLKAYIEEKERSFAWIVERQITRDIQINKGQVNKTYKVFPSEPKVYYNFKELTQNQIPVASFKNNQRIVLEDYQISTESRKIEESRGLKQAIQRQIKRDMIQDQQNGSQIVEAYYKKVEIREQ